MKYLTNLFTIVLIVLLSTHLLCAQDINQERMQRDINIMEGILEELFKTHWGARGSNVEVVSGQLTFGNRNEISGTYLEDYGVIFSIPGGPPAFVVMSDTKNKFSSYHFKYGDENDDEVTAETITARINEFLRDYGSTINQLNANDRITVIYKNNRPGKSNSIRLFSSSGSEVKKQKLPSISVTAKSEDLQAYRKRDISESEFNNRLSIKTIAENDSSNRDLKVMANILETTFEDTENDEFKIRGSVNHLYIDGVGALFDTGTSYGSGFWGINAFTSIGNKLSVVGKKLSEIDFDTIKTTPLKMDTLSVKNFSFSSDHEETKISKEDIKEAYQKFLLQLKETLVDYGRTLKSVQSDEQILVSISISNSSDNLPEKVDLRIQKSVLEGVDSGDVSREQAIEQITVREY